MSEALLKIRPAKMKEDDRGPKRGPLLMEQAFAALHSLRKQRAGVSLEIGFLDGKISFFARTKQKFASFVEGQIYAQYPDIDVSPIDANAFTPGSDEELQTVSLTLHSPEAFPIKRHPQFDDLLNRITVDPLASITSTLGRYSHPDMRGHIAISIRPIGTNYRKRVLKFLPLLSRGLSKKWVWYRKFFARVHLARGWKRPLLLPLDILMGGFRSIFQGIDVKNAVTLSTDGGELAREDHDTEVRHSARSHDREDDIQGAKDKVNKLLFSSSIRISVIAKKEHALEAKMKLDEIVSSFKQFDLPHSNHFCEGKDGARFLLSHEELATIWHLPTILVKTPNIDWVMSRQLEPPNELPTEGTGSKVLRVLTEDATKPVPPPALTILGESAFRGKRVKFGIKQDDRRRHIYIIGKTGMGKSTLLENMIFSDIHAGKGMAVIDPHGDLADAALRMIPKDRTNDVVLFDPTDREYPISFNMLECQNDEQRPLIASGLMAVFTKMWPDVWSGRMEHILRNTLLSLIESPGNSMLGIMRMFADDTFRNKIVSHISDPLVKSFWEDEYDNWSERFRTEAIAAIQNKVGQLLSTPIIRNIVGQVKSTLDVRHAMDSGKIIIANLSKGKLGEDNSAFLGSMLVTKFQIDAMSRADVEEEGRNDFYLYVDEFQNFATPSFATILSEARKYRLNLTMANQYTGQLTPDKSNTMLRDAVFGNVGSLISFQVGSEDAEELALQFGDEKLAEDLIGLPKYHAYMRLMIDGLTSKTFSVATLPPPEFEQDSGRVEKIRKLSRERYAEKRKVIEKKIQKWAESAKAAKDVQKNEAKAKEKEIEEIKKAKKKGMKLEEYRKWRDREMWTNSLNALKKKVNNGEELSKDEQKEMKELEEKLEKAGGATVEAAKPKEEKEKEQKEAPKEKGGKE